MASKDERQSINESVAIIEDSVTNSLDEITQDTESIAISIDTISKVAKVVGYTTVVFIGVKIVFAIFGKK